MLMPLSKFVLWALTATAVLGLVDGSSASAQTWVQRYAHGLATKSYARQVSTDSAGNVIVAGEVDTGITGYDWLIIQYSSAGVPQWTNRYNGPANSDDVVHSLAVNSGGNVYVSGSSYGIGGSADYATIAYTSAGVALWTNRYDGVGNNGTDEDTSIAVDESNGNVYVTGSSSSDYATIAYTSEGIALWTNRYNGANYDDHPAAVIVEGGNVFVTGSSFTTISNVVNTTIAYSSAGAALWTNYYQGLGCCGNARAIAGDGQGKLFVTGEEYDLGLTDYATIGYSTAGVPLWTNRYNGPGYTNDYAIAIVVDSNGQVYVTGSAYGAGSGYDYATVAYTSQGVALWTNLYNGTANSDDYAVALAADGSGNLFVTGYSLRAGGLYDYATIAYSSQGLPLWTNRYTDSANSNSLATALTVDDSGNVYVTGLSQGGGSIDYATVAYSNAGGPLWTNRFRGFRSYDDLPHAVVVDNGGKIYVTGSSLSDYATVACSAAGQLLWTNRYNGPANRNDRAIGIAVDSSGRVYVTGSSQGSGNPYDYVTIAYSSAGQALWTNRYGMANLDDQAAGLALDAGGNVYVTGSSQSTNTGYDYATIAYSSTGVPLWTNRYNGPATSDDFASGITVAGNGNVYVTGSQGGNSIYAYATIAYSSAGVGLWTNRYSGPGNYSLSTAITADDNGKAYVTGFAYGVGIVNSDYATIAYSSLGVPLWTNRHNGPANDHDIAHDLAVSADGKVFVTGRSGKTNNFPFNADYLTIAYSSAGVPLWTNLYNGPSNNIDQAAAVKLDDNGTVYVTGQSRSTSLSSSADCVTLAYSSVGVPLWTNRFDGIARGEDSPQTRHALAIASDGLVVVCASDGDFTGFNYFDYAIIKYVTPPKLGITHTNATVAVFWPLGYIGWKLERQSNWVSLENNWITVDDSMSTNRMFFQGVTGNAAAFFRLASP